MCKKLNQKPPFNSGSVFYSEARLIQLFDEWVKRYEENPKEFCAGYKGENSKSYGESCVQYLRRLEVEVGRQGSAKKACPAPLISK